MIKDRLYTLVLKREEALGVYTLFCAPVGRKKHFNFIPGQFVMIHLPESGFGKRGRAYTLTSLPEDEHLSFAIKRIGPFSNTLGDLKVGQRLAISGPFGSFFPTTEATRIVCIAGGIGVTPFLTVIKGLLKTHRDGVQITLFYSNKTKKDIAFFDELNAFQERAPWLSVVFVLTREKVVHPRIKEFKRMTVRTLSRYLKTLRNRYYYVCGSAEFNGGMVRKLIAARVNARRIHTETFF